MRGGPRRSVRRRGFDARAVVLFAAMTGACATGMHRAHGPAAARESPSRLPSHAATTTLPTVESNDPSLSAAVAAAAIQPSAANERRVAERYRDLGILDAASDHFSRALRFDPHDSAAYEGLARIWRDWGFPQLGLADAARAVYYAPASAAVHNTLGTLLAATGQRVAARREYERAVSLDSHAAYALNNLCALSLDEGNRSQAVSECRAALELEPRLAAARKNLAHALPAATP